MTPPPDVRGVRIRAEDATLDADLAVPVAARGVIAFAHGSGSGRRSPRNRFVARGLQQGGLATLLLDLLTEDEERVDVRTRHLRFDVDLLARRLVAAADDLAERPGTADLPLGLFGASTGAAAALVAAAERPAAVRAVVSRGGRPDLAGDALPRVRAPTLLVVGGRDETVLERNERAIAAMRAPTELETVPGATHLFEEEGALEAVVRHARGWFERHLFERHPEGPDPDARSDGEETP